MAFMIKEAEVLYDARGKKRKVILPYKKYEELLERLEDAYDIAKMNEVRAQATTPWRDARKKLLRKKR
jgi:hypothetical protein